MSTQIEKLIMDGFSESSVQAFYKKKATDGFWLGETEMISRYFSTAGGKILDLGCGTGRTTIPLHEMGYHVIGVDLVPQMIQQANLIAKEKNLTIDYRVGNATNLLFDDNTFDGVLFSNQGWTQIPGSDNRLKALREIHRVLKPGGIYIFTAHPRVIYSKFAFFWIWQWIRFYFLKPLGFKIWEQNYGDRLFKYSSEGLQFVQQYIHVPRINDVTKLFKNNGFEILEVNPTFQISNTDVRKYPPVFFVVKKPN